MKIRYSLKQADLLFYSRGQLYFWGSDMRNSIRLFLFIFIASFFACNEDEECVGCNLNPKIKLKFESIYTKPVIDTLFTAVNDSIAARVNLLSGQLSTSERSIIEEELLILREDSLKYDESYNLFRVSKTKIDAIEAPGSISLEQLQDTIIRDFAIPIDMHHDTSTFYFSYHGFTDTLQLYYQREITQTFDGVRMKINEIGVNEEISTFDSIRIRCYKASCSNDQTTIYVYF